MLCTNRKSVLNGVYIGIVFAVGQDVVRTHWLNAHDKAYEENIEITGYRGVGFRKKADGFLRDITQAIQR